MRANTALSYNMNPFTVGRIIKNKEKFIEYVKSSVSELISRRKSDGWKTAPVLAMSKQGYPIQKCFTVTFSIDSVC